MPRKCRHSHPLLLRCRPCLLFRHDLSRRLRAIQRAAPTSQAAMSSDRAAVSISTSSTPSLSGNSRVACSSWRSFPAAGHSSNNTPGQSIQCSNPQAGLRMHPGVVTPGILVRLGGSKGGLLAMAHARSLTTLPPSGGLTIWSIRAASASNAASFSWRNS